MIRRPALFLLALASLSACLRSPLAPPKFAPTATPTPVCGFTNLGTIGCKASDALTVIRSAADWAAYQALPGCGTAVAGALTGFDFTTQMVLDYDYHSCDAGYFECSVAITDVCVFWDRIEVHVLKQCSDTGFLNPALALKVCSGSAVAVPQSGL